MINQRMKSTKYARGYTLIEMLFVFALIAIAVVIFKSGSKGSTTNASATALESNATALVNSFSLATMKCGTGSSVDASTLTTAGTATATLTAILTGTGIAADKQACYADSGSKPLSGASRGSAAAETILGYRVTWTMIDATHIGVTYLAVDEQTALSAYAKYSSASNANQATSLPAAGDSSDPYIRFSPVSSARSNVTFVIAI